MPVETTTEVGELSRVQDNSGNQVPPANANQQAEIAAALGNPDGVAAGLVTPDDDQAETLPAVSVPDGVEVLVQGAADNDAAIYVGAPDLQPVALRQAQGIVLPVSDLSNIAVRCPSAGDSAAFIVVGGQQ